VSDTPKTDAFREVIFAQYKEDELTGDGMGNILAALPDIEAIEIERDELRSDLEFRRGLFKLQEEQLNEVRAELDRIREERYQYRGILIRLYNDLFVHHKGEAVRDFKALFREENYN
jgi:hypothetical protein